MNAIICFVSIAVEKIAFYTYKNIDKPHTLVTHAGFTFSKSVRGDNFIQMDCVYTALFLSYTWTGGARNQTRQLRDDPLYLLSHSRPRDEKIRVGFLVLL